MRFKLLLATLITSSTLVFSSVAMAESAADAIKAAKAAQKEASTLGFEWRDMGKTIKKGELNLKFGFQTTEKFNQVLVPYYGQIGYKYWF